MHELGARRVLLVHRRRALRASDAAAVAALLRSPHVEVSNDVPHQD
jgi:hypothetical protein